VNVDFNVFGGKSLSNAAIALNGGKNTTFKSGQLISVDAGTEAVILVQAKDWRFMSVSFGFNYSVSGEQYSPVQQYFMGPEGKTWRIVAIAVGSFIGLLLLVAIIICFIKCNRKQVKVHSSLPSIKHEPIN